MPANNVEIETRSPPSAAISVAKQMALVEGATRIEVRPHTNGWELVASGDTPNGQEFVDSIMKLVDNPRHSTSDPEKVHASAVVRDPRFTQ